MLERIFMEYLETIGRMIEEFFGCVFKEHFRSKIFNEHVFEKRKSL